MVAIPNANVYANQQTESRQQQLARFFRQALADCQASSFRSGTKAYGRERVESVRQELNKILTDNFNAAAKQNTALPRVLEFDLLTPQEQQQYFHQACTAGTLRHVTNRLQTMRSVVERLHADLNGLVNELSKARQRNASVLKTVNPSMYEKFAVKIAQLIKAANTVSNMTELKVYHDQVHNLTREVNNQANSLQSNVVPREKREAARRVRQLERNAAQPKKGNSSAPPKAGSGAAKKTKQKGK